jgi:hypothetical protein
MIRNRHKSGYLSEQLRGQLNNYSVAIRSAVSGTLRGRNGRWPIYAAAVGSALAMGTNASASMIYCGPSNNYCDPSGPHHSAPQAVATAATHEHIQPIGLDGSGHFFNLEAKGGTSFGQLSGQAPSPVHVFVTGPGSSLVKKFLTSAAIGAGPAKASAEIVKFASAGTVLGQFVANQTGFAAFSIAGIPGGTEYGWIRLEFMNGASGYPATLEAIDWAVGAPGQKIVAGQETTAPSAPEPGTLPLSLLASGAAGVMALRRKKSA